MDLMKFCFTTSSSKKKRTQDETTKEMKKAYEAKRERLFQSNWIEEFPGLKYAVPIDDHGETDDTKKNIMICKVCLDNQEFADRNCSLFLGTSTFRKDTLIAHWKSVAHRRCEEKQKQKERMKMETTGSETPGTSGPLVNLVRQMEKEVEDQIIRLFNTAYFICKQEKPFTDYPRLIVLQEVNGLNMGNFYRSDNACRRYI